MSKNQFWASLVAFLSDFEHGVKKKILRLKGSKNILKLNFFFHKYFGEKDIGEIGLSFSSKPDKKKNSTRYD